MSIEVSLVLSGLSLIASVIFGVSTMRRGQRAETQQDTTQLTTVIVKLENIGEGISEIKTDMRNIKSDVQELRERLVKVEASASSAHRRLDTIETRN